MKGPPSGRSRGPGSVRLRKSNIPICFWNLGPTPVIVTRKLPLITNDDQLISKGVLNFNSGPLGGVTPDEIEPQPLLSHASWRIRLTEFAWHFRMKP